jgi:hypothetical protein
MFKKAAVMVISATATVSVLAASTGFFVGGRNVSERDGVVDVTEAVIEDGDVLVTSDRALYRGVAGDHGKAPAVVELRGRVDIETGDGAISSRGGGRYYPELDAFVSGASVSTLGSYTLSCTAEGKVRVTYPSGFTATGWTACTSDGVVHCVNGQIRLKQAGAC